MGYSIVIYQVFRYNTELPTYFDEATNINAKADAEALLAQRQKETLESEACRFSICAVFTVRNRTTWRELRDTDPEDTICQVFDTFTGTYTQVNSKTEAYALNRIKQANFLASTMLDKVYEVDVIPSVLTEPLS